MLPPNEYVASERCFPTLLHNVLRALVPSQQVVAHFVCRVAFQRCFSVLLPSVASSVFFYVVRYGVSIMRWQADMGSWWLAAGRGMPRVANTPVRPYMLEGADALASVCGMPLVASTCRGRVMRSSFCKHAVHSPTNAEAVQ